MVNEIMTKLRKKQHVMIVGQRGMGKSYTLDLVKKQIPSDSLIAISGSSTRKAIAIQLLQRCWDDEHDIGVSDEHEEWTSVQKEFRNEGIEQLLSRCADYMKLYTFSIDDMELMTPLACSEIMPNLLTGLVIATANISEKTKEKRIQGAINSFQKVELDTLDRETINGLLWSLIDKNEYQNPKQIETKVWNQSLGVPGVVVEMVDQLGDSKSIRDVQDLTHQAPAVPMINLLPPTLMAALIYFVLMRLMSRGMDDPSAYIIGMTGYTLLRIFINPIIKWADG